MALNLFVPEIGPHSKEHSVKDLVVLILSTEFPLSLKQVHHLVVRKYGADSSLQATFKAISYLVENGVIEKSGKDYSLSRKWINGLKSFAADLELNYCNGAGLPVIGENGNLSLEFQTIADVDKFIFSKLESYPRSEKKVSSKMFLEHLWWPLFYSFKEYLSIKQIGEKIDLEIFCRGDTVIDKWCAKYYSGFGFKVKTGFKHRHESDLIIFGDYVIQIFYPKNVMKKIKETFLRHREISSINLTEFYPRIFEKKVKVEVLINRSKMLAEQFSKL
ncbi:MAG: hypothetical protein WC308_01315 [archaeon]